jgi:hypothetical protein
MVMYMIKVSHVYIGTILREGEQINLDVAK